MKFIKNLLILAAFLPAAFTSCAANFELAQNPKNILYVTTNGNDALGWYGNNGRNWRSVDAAITNALKGDKIIIGPGNFTNTFSGTLAVAQDVHIVGAGTNSTFVYGAATIRILGGSELSGFTWTGDAFRLETNNSYLHDLVLKSGATTLFAAEQISVNDHWNVISNCLFVPLNTGLNLNGTNFLYNCRIIKDPASIEGNDALLQTQGYNYFSGGSISSFTNDYAIYNLNSPHPLFAFVQNSTLTVGPGGYQFNGDALNSNLVNSVTFTMTNSTAKVYPFSGFSNTNQFSTPWKASWTTRPNTNGLFVLPAPPTNH